MIGPAEETFIQDHAHIPEHIPGYGSVMSAGEPYLVEDFLVYFGRDTLVFIGYPLEENFDENRISKILTDTIRRFSPEQAVLIAPSVPSYPGTRGRPDAYYRLDLVHDQIHPKVLNMVHRAGREVRVETGRSLGTEHRLLVDDFMATPDLEDGSRTIFKKIPEYISSVPTAEIFSAVDASGNLVAFDIVDFGSRQYAFYMFNFRSRRHKIPGASDLLIHAIIQESRARDKIFLNMGLGLNAGVEFFKEKWRAVPFLHYQSLHFSVKKPSWLESFFQGLIKG
jgi:hypothetical protein